MATRDYSSKQEKYVAKKLKGKVQPNSGATMFAKGDVIFDDWLIECKTKVKDSNSISVKRDWIVKNEEEAFAMGKAHSAVCFSFGDNTNYYIITEQEFKKLLYKEGQI